MSDKEDKKIIKQGDSTQEEKTSVVNDVKEAKQDEKNPEVKDGKKSVKNELKAETKEPAGLEGLEELPEDIRKKLEKKKAENAQKNKKSKVRKKKKKTSRIISTGTAYIKSTYNNTIVNLTDKNGNSIAWASAGVAGFRGPKKSTPYAAQIITRLAVAKAREEYGLKEVNVFVKGVGTGRESAIRALNNNGLIVTSIKDITPVPHNGCRPKKPRRV